MPICLRHILCATALVVPDHKKESNTISQGSVESLSILSISLSGLGVQNESVLFSSLTSFLAS